ncbi:hypothetical protein phytr_1130 [Candidatus Phycorickettsia trachydisci]|uniref:Uncharacterized protein n=1 Tax=Candidatus Phycorickettsia trachydisci TaxID=2115978 RepID=A0A2P1P721_9RICK|nr:ankyrin repeat domain-containing protein [Candidatus Phycorickettsia trachydisci]AVP87074.1 hypothetical protein phytr_1130 [Candidatus Phycorickettsia trachydisci]
MIRTIRTEYEIWNEKYNRLNTLIKVIKDFIDNPKKPKWAAQEKIINFRNDLDSLTTYDKFEESKVQDIYDNLKNVFNFLEDHEAAIEELKKESTQEVEVSNIRSFQRVISEYKSQINNFLIDARLRFYSIQEDVDKEYMYGETLLYRATDRRDIENIKRLLDQGADPLKTNKLSHSPLSLALSKGLFTLATELLLEKIKNQAPAQLNEVAKKIDDIGLLNCIEEIDAELGLDITHCAGLIYSPPEIAGNDEDYSLKVCLSEDTRQTIGVLDHEGWNINWYSKGF